MKIFKISHGTGFINTQNFNLLKINNLISMGSKTGALGQSRTTQYDFFLQAKKGDLFFLCRSNETIELIGMFADNRPLPSIMKEYEDEWVDREYIAIARAVNPEGYLKSLSKWWAPGANSTFVEIPSGEYTLFEKEILIPVFDKKNEEIKKEREIELGKILPSIEKYQELQLFFKEIIKNETAFFLMINNLDKLELRKLYFEYCNKGNIELQPVVLLRSKILEQLLLGNVVDDTSIKLLKSQIGSNFEKKVYKSWTSNFRILYTLLFASYKSELEFFFDDLITKIQVDLDITGLTNKNLVHFDGAQNQGYDSIWFAIYNKTYKSQKYAKQLFLIISDGFEYGLIDHVNRENDRKIKSEKFDYNHIIEIFTSHKQEILNDNSMEKAKISEYIDILENKKQIILQGPPGTGKTYTAEKMAEQLLGSLDSNQYKIIQFHPSFSYEDFVRGINTRVENTANGSQLVYETKNKVFADLADLAYKSQESGSEDKFVLVIDEINRANLPSVLGELIYGLEYRDKAITTMYAINDDYTITIPENLYIIGTMNTADRSVGHIDYAIKRRFAFIDIEPNVEVISFEKAKELFNKVSELFSEEFLAPDFDKKDVQLGHSYFMTDSEDLLKMKWQYEILPILNEYIKDGILLEAAKDKIEIIKVGI